MAGVKGQLETLIACACVLLAALAPAASSDEIADAVSSIRRGEKARWAISVLERHFRQAPSPAVGLWLVRGYYDLVCYAFGGVHHNYGTPNRPKPYDVSGREAANLPSEKSIERRKLLESMLDYSRRTLGLPEIHQSRWREFEEDGVVFKYVALVELAYWYLDYGHPEDALKAIDLCQQAGDAIPSGKYARLCIERAVARLLQADLADDVRLDALSRAAKVVRTYLTNAGSDKAFQPRARQILSNIELLQAQLLINAGKLDEGLDMLAKAQLHLIDREAEIAYWRGKVYYEKWRQAREETHEKTQLAQKARGALASATASQSGRLPDDLAENARRMLASLPSPGRRRLDQFGQVQRLLDEARSAEPKRREELLHKAYQLCKEKSKAAKSSKEKAKWSELLSRTLRDRGLSYYVAAQWEKARRLFEEWVRQTPQDSEAHFWLGLALAALKAQAEGAERRRLNQAALREFLRAKQLGPPGWTVDDLNADLAGELIEYGVNLCREGRRDEGIEALNKACELGAEIPAAYWLGTNWTLAARKITDEKERSDLYRRAMPLLERALLEPSYELSAREMLAEACMETGDYEGAAFEYRRIAERAPSTRIYYMLAAALYSASQAEQRAAFDKRRAAREARRHKKEVATEQSDPGAENVIRAAELLCQARAALREALRAKSGPQNNEWLQRAREMLQRLAVRKGKIVYARAVGANVPKEYRRYFCKALELESGPCNGLNFGPRVNVTGVGKEEYAVAEARLVFAEWLATIVAVDLEFTTLPDNTLRATSRLYVKVYHLDESTDGSLEKPLTPGPVTKKWLSFNIDYAQSEDASPSRRAQAAARTLCKHIGTTLRSEIAQMVTARGQD